MGIASCCGQYLKLSNDKNTQVMTQTIMKNENSISIDYFLNQIPKDIIKQMDQEEFEEFQNSKNNDDIRTEKINFDDTSSMDFNNNIKEILYHGEYNKNGKKEGLGKMIIITENEKIFYHGIWENDNIYKGSIYYQDGSKYTGDIKNNKRNGKGEYKSQMEIYVGNWKDDQKDGEGTLTFGDGTEYIGFFKDGQFNGEGKIKCKDGFSYQGNFLNNCMHGKGYLRGKNDHIYEGYFKNGKFHGSGTFKWINRNSTEYYKGNYICGQKDGKGEFHFSNGHVYNGSWKSGEPDGEGIYETKNRKYIGNWRSGIFMQLIEVEEKERMQEENVNLTFKVPIEDICISDHISTSINSESSNKSSVISPYVTVLQ